MVFLDNEIDYASYDFLNQKVVLKSMPDNSFLLDSIVIDDDKTLHTIQVKTNNPDVLKKAKSVYVFFPFEGKPIQFQGKVRKAFLDNAVEIAISKGEEVKLREHTRFTTKIPTIINSVIIENQEVAFNNPIKANITDLSAAGIALEAPPLAFEKGDIIKVSFKIDDDELEYHYQVLRVGAVNVDTFSYGCKITEI